MVIEYVFVVTFFVVLGVAAFVRIRYPFWSVQPVFHTYDVWRYWCGATPYVIQTTAVSSPTKFLNHALVKTQAFVDATDKDRAQILDLVQCHSLSSDCVSYTLTETDLAVHCGSHLSASCLVSTLLDAEGVLVAYPVRFALSGVQTTLFYWDHVVLHRQKNPDLTRTLIQTHEANQRRLYPEIPSSLFRKNVDMSEGIVPLIKFTVSLFSLKQSNVKKPPLAPHCTVTRIGVDKMYIFMDFLFELSTQQGRACLFPEMPAAQARIEANQWLVFAMQSQGQVLAMYAFKDTKMAFEEGGGNCLELMASRSAVDDKKAFFAGWLHALHDILAIRPEFGTLSVSNLGHNSTLVDTWKWKYAPVSTHESAFFLYNLVCSPVAPEQCVWISL
jgi:hypothetical protein